MESINTLFYVIGVIIGTGLIEISPLKINPWTWIMSPLRKALNQPIMDEVKAVNKKVGEVQAQLDEHIRVSEEGEALTSRNRILRFNDEILEGKQHSKEHYDNLLETIDEYETFCTAHPEFPNNKCLMAIENIKEEYKERLHNGSFTIIRRQMIKQEEK